MNRLLTILTILTLTYSFMLTSCATILGLNKLKSVDEKTIVQYAEKYNIPLADNYELDTTYFTFLKSLDTTRYKEQIKNHYQPLQALYYDKKGQLQSFQINCFAGGFPNLNWNKNGVLETFPPKKQAALDSIIPLDTQMRFLKPLTNTDRFSTDNFDYIVVVYWSQFMGRQSKRFIRFVQDNEKLAINKKVKLIYANTDNFFADK